jgi:sigma-E factor negative regulatory protein RseA
MQSGMRQQNGSEVTSVIGSPAGLTDLNAEAEWLSAFIDGETGDEDYAGALAKAGARTDWDVYHLIGDVMRSPGLAQPLHAGFSAKVAAAIASEPAIVAAPRRRNAGRRTFVTRYGLPGLAAAAAVASVTWMAQPYFAPGGLGLSTASIASSVGPADAGRLPAGVQLADYLDAHRQYSGLSSVRQVSVSVGTPASQR